MLAASSGKRNVTVRLSVRLSVCLVFFLALIQHAAHFVITLIGRAAHTQHDSPGGST